MENTGVPPASEPWSATKIMRAGFVERRPEGDSEGYNGVYGFSP